MKPTLLILFFGLFYAVGLAVIGFGAWSARRSMVAARWPVAIGTMEACSLEAKTDGEGSTTYGVNVQYGYDVDGKPYTGTRVAFGYTASNNRLDQDKILAALESAKSVEVRYDPRDPATSTLSFGIHRSIRFMLAFGITWLAFVVGFNAIWWVASHPDDVLLRNLVIR